MKRVKAFSHVMSEIFVGSDYERVNSALTLFMLRKLRYWASMEIIRSMTKCPGLMLDLGSGNGSMSRYLFNVMNNSRGQLMSYAKGFILMDPSEEGLRKARELGPMVDVVVGVSEMMPIRDSSICIAYSAFAFRQFSNKVMALRELHRILKAGGYFILLEFWRPNNIINYIILLFYLTLPLTLITALISPTHIRHYATMRYTVLDIGDIEWLRRLVSSSIGHVNYVKTYMGIFVVLRAINNTQPS